MHLHSSIRSLLKKIFRFIISIMENTTVVDAELIQVTGKLVIKNLVGVMIDGFRQKIDSEKFMFGDI